MYSYETPSSIVKTCSEFSHKIDNESLAIEKRILHNKNRCKKITNNKHAALRLRKELQSWILKDKLDNVDFLVEKYFYDLRAKLGECSNQSMYRSFNSNGALEYIASKRCKHKLCPICNSERKSNVRSKYLNYFKKNEFIDQTTGEVLNREDFNFMHLMLSVPHTEKGWRGKSFYVKEMIEQFNFMRKKSEWKKMVFGGEFGVEVTKNENGLHIHMHCLLMVHKSQYNRNELGKFILLNWNKQTIDENATRTEFTAEQIEAILKGCKLSPDELSKLNPKGSTFIHLQNLYFYSKEQISPNDKLIFDTEKGKIYKHYADPSNETELIKGVLECIKYHFKPICFKEGGIYDFDLMAEILPGIYRRQLYKKFGNLHGVKELNLVDDTENLDEKPDISKAEQRQILEDHGREIVFNTVSKLPDSEYQYICTKPTNIFFTKNNDEIRLIENSPFRVRVLESQHLVNAIQEMINISLGQNVNMDTLIRKLNPNPAAEKQKRKKRSLTQKEKFFKQQMKEFKHAKKSIQSPLGKRQKVEKWIEPTIEENENLSPEQIKQRLEEFFSNKQ